MVRLFLVLGSSQPLASLSANRKNYLMSLSLLFVHIYLLNYYTYISYKSKEYFLYF
ncbi:hypothetical protein EMIT079MI2_30283 [Bacillus sp. IT-79MI2]